MDTTSEAFFDAIYRHSDDPWSFTTDPTERSRYADIVSLLDNRRFRLGFEPGCSIGELTVMLAPHCDQLLAIDISPRAVALAKQRCVGLANVAVRHGRLPEALPVPGVDLVVLSEIGYYFTADQLIEVLEALADRAAPRALLVGSHWTGTSSDHLLSGSEVQTIVDSHPRWQTVSGYEEASYVIGSWTRR